MSKNVDRHSARQHHGPNEYVLYTAHWDHLGRCDAGRRRRHLQRRARQRHRHRRRWSRWPRRMPRPGPHSAVDVFMAVTAEEFGCSARNIMPQHPIFPLAHTVGGVNMDGLNVIGQHPRFRAHRRGQVRTRRLCPAVVAGQGRVIRPNRTPEKGGYYRSDHFSFAKLGVPMLAGGSGRGPGRRRHGGGHARGGGLCRQPLPQAGGRI